MDHPIRTKIQISCGYPSYSSYSSGHYTSDEEEDREYTNRQKLLRSSIHSIIDEGLRNIGDGPRITFESNPELNTSAGQTTWCGPRLRRPQGGALIRRATTRAAKIGHRKRCPISDEKIGKKTGIRPMSNLAPGKSYAIIFIG